MAVPFWLTLLREILSASCCEPLLLGSLYIESSHSVLVDLSHLCVVDDAAADGGGERCPLHVPAQLCWHWSEMLLILQVSPQHCMRITTTVIKKVKVAHTQLLSVGFWSWSQFLAVSLQVTVVCNHVPWISMTFDLWPVHLADVLHPSRRRFYP